MAPWKIQGQVPLHTGRRPNPKKKTSVGNGYYITRDVRAEAWHALAPFSSQKI